MVLTNLFHFKSINIKVLYNKKTCYYIYIINIYIINNFYIRNKNKTDSVRGVNILMRKGMGHTAVSAT